VRALRYYETQGLLTPTRSHSGQRYYAEAAIDKVRFFQDMYAAGLTSRHIATLLPCIDSGHTDDEQRQMLLDQRERIADRIDELQAALRRLDNVIAAAQG
jgi:DNA-binding transcriptional MerR regulator